MSDARRFLFILATITLALTALFSLVEIGFRLAGAGPWDVAAAHPTEPTMHEADPVLGWRNKEGSYAYPAYVPDEKPVEVTILADGSRATRAVPKPAQTTVLLIGGSFTRGSGVSDSETFAWKLQERYPFVAVRNQGTGAYGTYQSLLLLERALSERPAPLLVIYGFAPFHGERNEAGVLWLRLLSANSRGGIVSVPYVTLGDDGELLRHPPKAYRVWPLSRLLASLNWLQHRYDEYLDRQDKNPFARRRKEMRILILEMERLCRQNGTEFLVAMIYAEQPVERKYFTHAFERDDIAFINCSRPLTRGLTVPGEGHPNGKMHTLYANCISEAIHDRILRQQGPESTSLPQTGPERAVERSASRRIW